MADIEFITQYLVLKHANEFEQLTVYSDNVRILTDAANIGCITKEQKQQLIKAYIDYRSCYHVLSLEQKGKLIPRETFLQDITNVTNIWNSIFELN